MDSIRGPDDSELTMSSFRESIGAKVTSFFQTPLQEIEGGRVHKTYLPVETVLTA